MKISTSKRITYPVAQIFVQKQDLQLSLTAFCCCHFIIARITCINSHEI